MQKLSKNVKLSRLKSDVRAAEVAVGEVGQDLTVFGSGL